MGPYIGVVADDVTGAVDLGGEIAACGLGTVVVLGVPEPGDSLTACESAVVALSSRNAPAAAAVRDSVASARWLLDHDARWLYQKYCSTFDSTDAGNIGPVADALAQLTNGLSVGTPATPPVGRTQYLGHLFVGDRLLSESPLLDHPLTPMRDPDLVRVLSRQTPARVGLVPWPRVRSGPTDIREALTRCVELGARHILVDALEEADLDVLAEALLGADAGWPLLGGGAGFATALARRRRATAEVPGPRTIPTVESGPALVLAGSCSARTLEQVARHNGPALRVGATEIAQDEEGTTERALRFIREAWGIDRIPLVHSTAEPEVIQAEQQAVGAARAATLVERTLGVVARRAVEELGARRLIVAGGETSGAVARALGARALQLGPRVEPGLSWTVTASATGPAANIALLLKSGNFGSPDLFTTAWAEAP